MTHTMNAVAFTGFIFVLLGIAIAVIAGICMRKPRRKGIVAPADNSDPKTIACTCTKEHPFVPPRMYGEYWIHVDAVETNPDYDGEVVQFYCPNCGIYTTVDFRW